jgi:Tetratricopeptide repeat
LGDMRTAAPPSASLRGTYYPMGFESPEAARLLKEAVFYLSERGRYIDAAPLYERAITIRGKALGSEHPDAALILNKLAEL